MSHLPELQVPGLSGTKIQGPDVVTVNSVPREAPLIFLRPIKGQEAIRESKGHLELYRGVLGPGNTEEGLWDGKISSG